jgi:hypothetical protein
MSLRKSHRSTIYLTTAVPPWMKVEVARLAEETSVSMSDIQRTAINFYLNARDTAHA